MIDIVQQKPNTTIDNNKTNPDKMTQHNKDLKSYFEQLAIANGVKGFSLVIDNALTPRYDVKRISAPPAINGATRKFLSHHQADDDAAPSYPSRRRSSGVEAFQRGNGSFMRWSAPSSLETTNATSGNHTPTSFDRFSAGSMNKNPNFLETVFDEVDSILYEEKDDDDDDDDHHLSVESDEISTGENESQTNDNNAQHDDDVGKPKDTRFDSNIGGGGQPPRPMSRPPVTPVPDRQRKIELPKLPVRQESIDDFSTALNNRDSSSTTISLSSSTTDSPSTLVPPLQASFATCVPIEETRSWHEDDEDDDDDDESSSEVNHHRPIFVPPPTTKEDDSDNTDYGYEDADAELERQNMASSPPPPLEEPSPSNDDEFSKYGRRRRSSNRRRRSSLDTGHTFRNSFNSVNSGSSGEDSGSGELKSRWD
ncbi:unnamed protein product [Cylindrotheca closterium]|uniref:Uncharacterized protein n=1 Tax=Cylindrotheca closterium TaxID=2856 RepID=A0AAD2G1F7_9STRA|nr:unnamed protein product [Cylindrotheca closterium]